MVLVQYFQYCVYISVLQMLWFHLAFTSLVVYSLEADVR